jgi:hypothetical protein
MIDIIIKTKSIIDKKTKRVIGKKDLLFGFITIKKVMYGNKSSKTCNNK